MGPIRAKTQSGQPLLSNDPHIGFGNPGFWYEADINTPNHKLHGYYLPGVAFAGLGQNSKKAWGINQSAMDDTDYYVEKLHPENPNLVMFKNEWVPLKVYDEEIIIKDEDSFKFQVKETNHGPIIDDSSFGVSGQVISLKWAFHHPDNHLIKKYLQIKYL